LLIEVAKVGRGFGIELVPIVDEVYWMIRRGKVGVDMVDRWVLGFDSGIARSGVAVYDVERGDWSFTFLRAGGYRYAQFTCLIKFAGYYVGCLGSPTVIIVSRDLKYWYPLYIEGTSTPTVGYNHFVNAIVWGERIVAVTGRELLVFDYDVERVLGESLS
jgi:hypothetical protein